MGTQVHGRGAGGRDLLDVLLQLPRGVAVEDVVHLRVVLRARVDRVLVQPHLVMGH